MSEPNVKAPIVYRPVLFTAGVFVTTWICAVLMSYLGDTMHRVLFVALDFVESASPLLAALFLLWVPLRKNRSMLRFFLGERKGFVPYLLVFGLFAVQFLNFYLFRAEGGEPLSLGLFGVTFAGQLLLGGGLEEAGWRGYLLPALERKLPTLPASLCVSMIWVVWHLPYFILPGSMHSGGDFFSYSLIGIITGFILTAIYKLTGSILLCTLFHSWQNTIVMTVRADMQQPGFMITFLLLGAVSAAICLFLNRKKRVAAR